MYKLQIILVSPSVYNRPVYPNTTASSNITSEYPQQFIANNTTNNLLCKKFLHLTSPSTSILQLSQEIIQKCHKLYPTLASSIDIQTIKDSQDCDLDPDYLISDVFDTDNTVKVYLQDDLVQDRSPPPLKKQRLNSNSNVLKIQKNARRISTPLANEILPDEGDEEEVAADRSFLPPPTNPQSPPIRISSGLSSKRINSIPENAVSISEMVDPSKSKQQRLLLSSTPIISNTMTPNRVTLTGQRVVSETNQQNKPIFSQVNTSQTPRIISGMLKIPNKPVSPSKMETTHQASIADNNGSPTRSNSISSSTTENSVDTVHLADLPQHTQRKSSLEAKVQNKQYAKPTNEKRRIVDFSDVDQNSDDDEPVGNDTVKITKQTEPTVPTKDLKILPSFENHPKPAVTSQNTIAQVLDNTPKENLNKSVPKTTVPAKEVIKEKEPSKDGKPANKGKKLPEKAKPAPKQQQQLKSQTPPEPEPKPKPKSQPPQSQLQAKTRTQQTEKNASKKPEGKPALKNIPSSSDKLKELKAKFTTANNNSTNSTGNATNPRTGLMPQKLDRDDDSSDDSSSSDSSSSSSDEDDEDDEKPSKTKRLVVDTPKGPLTSSGTSLNNNFKDLANAPQSTQGTNSAATAPLNNHIKKSELSEVKKSEFSNDINESPIQADSTLQGLPQKMRPSLSSLSDLVSRGVPDVRDGTMKASSKSINNPASSGKENSKEATSSEDNGSASTNDSSDDSTDDSSDSSSSSSSDDNGSFISAKTADAALGKRKKTKGGFASLIKDMRKK